MNIEERVAHLLKASNFPLIKRISYEERFPLLAEFIKSPRPIHFKCGSLSTRKIAKSIAISVAIDYLYESKTKYPPYYLIKPYFIDVYRGAYFNNRYDEINKIKEGSIIAFDGFDEITTQQEMNFISTFLSPIIMESKPLILISSGKFNEELINKYNASSFGTMILDLEEIFF